MGIAPQASVRNASKACKGKKRGQSTVACRCYGEQGRLAGRGTNSPPAHNGPNAENKRCRYSAVPPEAWAAAHGPVIRERKRGFTSGPSYLYRRARASVESAHASADQERRRIV